MTAPTTETPAPAAPEAAPAPEITATPAATAPEAAPDAPKPEERTLEGSLSALDEETRKFVLGEVDKARREANNLRTRATTAAETARNDLATAIGKAIGLVTDDAPVNPDELAAKLTAQTGETNAAKLALAVYQAAGSQFNVNALLDSLSFRSAIKDLDPTDTAAISGAISAAAEANPAFKASPTSRIPAPTTATGSSAGGAPDLDAEIAAAQKAGDVNRVISLQNQKLTAPAR